MQRSINRAVLSSLMARHSSNIALESDEVPAVVPTEAAANTTDEAVAAAAGEAGVPETPPVAETTAPTVIIKVEVEQASKPGAGAAPTAVVDSTPPEEPADETPADLAAETPSPEAGEAADVAAAADAPAEGGEAPAGDVPEAPAADASAEAPAEAGEAAPTEGAADAPADGEAGEAAPAPDAGADAAAAPAEAAESPVDAKPTEGEKAAAAEEVQTAIDETKAAGEEGAEASVAKEDLVVTSDSTPIGDEPEMITADQIAPELNEMSEELNTYNEGGEALGKISDILEASAEEGGLPKSAAQVLEVAVEHIHQTLKLPRPIGILAMEAFDEPGVRVSATSIAMEEIAKTARDVWETIKAAIVKFIGMIITFYDKCSEMALMHVRTATKYKKEAEALGDKGSEGKVIEDAALAKAFAVDQIVPQNIPTQLAGVNTALNKVIGSGGMYIDEITNLIGHTGGIDDAKAKLVNGLGTNVASVGYQPAPDLEKIGAPKPAEGANGFATPAMLGNYHLWAHVPKDVANLGNLKFGYAAANITPNTTKVPLLSAQEIRSVCESILNTHQTMLGLKDFSRKLKTTLNSFNAFVSKAENENAKPDRDLGKILHQLASGMSTGAVKVSTAINSSSLKYCQKSLATLAPKAAEAPAAEAKPAAAAPAAGAKPAAAAA